MSDTKKFTSRFAIIMVALMLVTCIFVGGTYAKYVTSGDGSDTARVAQFGVNVETTGEAFATSYEKHDNSFTLSANSVVSNEKVIAPGTDGTFAGFTITGTPEVAVRVTFEDCQFNLTGWEDADGNYYCPLEITVGATTLVGLDYSSIAEFKAAVENAINAYTHDYEAGTDLAAATSTDNPVISWSWAFEGNDDVNDTYLGDQAAAGNPSTVELVLNCKVTQID